jgi:hypothetical protein
VTVWDQTLGEMLERARKALDEAHRAEEEMHAAFDRSMAARARVLAAQSEGRPPESHDLELLERYYRRAEVAVGKGLQFVELSRQSAGARDLPGLSATTRKPKKESIEVMKIALRVLTALTEKSGPQASDVRGLLEFAPDLTHLPPDELACEVIQRAMKRQVHLQRALNTGSY